ncbi:putative peptide chain release factor 1 [Dictyocaulus viviparus]|uniref:Putative peptide chain release factor 1 n=1 Tax=Dictyocaulus viviparus TaxID=29172 RepID=A0A0D8XZP5_DICVI|nr:putative peptide chain release factor 1 [Dictyocaulus viviparus]
MRGSSYVLSTARSILNSTKGVEFLTAVEARLAAHRSGNNVSDDNRVRYWDSICRASNDEDLLVMVKEERRIIEKALTCAEKQLVDIIVPSTEIDCLRKCQMEFISGVGGQEAMLFTGELLAMYSRYIEWRGWKSSSLHVQESDLGGIRHALIAVEGENAYAALRFEAGVHRVQRIPQTDKSRMHTSTASVSVLPEPEEVSVVVPTHSVKIETMRASGPGGQNVNKRSTAVRITHCETGIAVHCMEERFQHLNMQIAFKRLAASLMQRKVDAIHEKFSSDKKLQIGSKARAEKIRTFSFQHDKVTDHRLQIQVSNIVDFMRGEDSLNNVIEKLEALYKEERLKNIIEQCIVD